MKGNLLAQGINFSQLNQTLQGMGFRYAASTPGEIISEVIKYIFIIAGLALFGFLIWGGFEFLTSAGDPDRVKAAQGKLTGAIAGFLIIFAAYWLAQILEIIFGLEILG